MTKLAFSALFAAVFAAACVAPAGYYPPPTAPAQQPATQDPSQVAQPQPEPAPVDTRNPAQVTVDILKGAGYACTENANAELWCNAPQDGWQFDVWFENQPDGTIQVVFDSFLNRAFGQPCSQFDFAMQDLRDDANGFSATCEDNIQKFRMRQRLVYNETLDVPGWAADHLNRRLVAGKKLRSIHALAKDDARALSRR